MIQVKLRGLVHSISLALALFISIWPMMTLGAGRTPVFEVGDTGAENKCRGSVEPYQVWDFPLDSGRWSFCTSVAGRDELPLVDLTVERLLKGISFEHAVESNRRGLLLMQLSKDEKQYSYRNLKKAGKLFSHASSLGLAEAYSNLALNQFVLTNMEASLKAAEIGALLKQPEAMGLLAYYQIEAIYTERNLASALQLTLNAEALGADLSYIRNLDVSYQFFKTHWAEVQKSLGTAGFFNGEMDGVFGDDAKASLTAYQVSNDLPVTEKINLELLDRLGILDRFNEHVEAQQYIYGNY